ncbi:[FeFe] hydrogenase H-cluster maturation GTPase HydF [bacterium]|nr:[FeFe] hydrogenase H-cluster maturation GTPase HydF [bacterium]
MKALKSNRLHIGIFGKTNVGKSSFLNKITGQEVSIVSNIAGTTTDVVEKSMELLPIGPVNFLDSAGLDDDSVLGDKRIEKTVNILNRTDIAVLICDSRGLNSYDMSIISKFKELNIPFVVLINKSDEKIIADIKLAEIKSYTDNIIITSVKKDSDIIFKFKSAILKLLPEDFINTPQIVGDIVKEGSIVVLVIPIDKEAPKGRIILPQVQTLRDLLDNACITIAVRDSELKSALDNLKKAPALVITDSQAFKKVDEIVPQNINLTSFSILFARLKGDLNAFVQGAKTIDNLQDGDKVLILESCTHHAIEDDIGRVKIPYLLRKKTGKNLIIENFSGHEFPDITPYKLIIHCGACMTNRKEVLSRILLSNKAGVPITNYGIAISYCLGILDRALKIFLKK